MTLKQEAEAIIDRLTPGMVEREPETIVAWIEKALAAERQRCAEALCEGCAAGNPIQVICGERVHPCSGLPSNYPCAAQAIYEPE